MPAPAPLYLENLSHRILSDASFLHAEPFEAEEFLSEEGELFGGDLRHEKLWCVARVACVLQRVFDVCHAFDVVLLRDSNGLTEVQRVNSALFVHDHHDVIGRLVIDQNLSVSVKNQPSGRILNLFPKGIGVGVLFVVVTPKLQREKSDQIDENDADRDATNDKFADFKVLVQCRFFLRCGEEKRTCEKREGTETTP